MTINQTKSTAVIAACAVVAGAAIIIHHHHARDAWRVPDVSPAIVQRVAPQIRILPTRFPGANELVQANPNFDKFVGINVSVAEMVALAYRGESKMPVPAQRIVFRGPTPPERYDFAATLTRNAAEALQEELKSKLGFVARREMRDAGPDVLALRVGRPGAPQLKPATGRTGNITGTGDGVQAGLKCDNQTISTVAAVISEILQAPVVDQTGLAGQFSFELAWNDTGGQARNHEALKAALREQLGLELAPAHDPVEMLVVDRIQ